MNERYYFRVEQAGVPAKEQCLRGPPGYSAEGALNDLSRYLGVQGALYDPSDREAPLSGLIQLERTKTYVLLAQGECSQRETCLSKSEGSNATQCFLSRVARFPDRGRSCPMHLPSRGSTPLLVLESFCCDSQVYRVQNRHRPSEPSAVNPLLLS